MTALDSRPAPAAPPVSELLLSAVYAVADLRAGRGDRLVTAKHLAAYAEAVGVGPTAALEQIIAADDKTRRSPVWTGSRADARITHWYLLQPAKGDRFRDHTGRVLVASRNARGRWRLATPTGEELTVRQAVKVAALHPVKESL